jgi:hypothetical protein
MEIDFICTAGGMKAMFISDCIPLLKDKGFIVSRASGASSGSFAAVCVLANIDARRCKEIYTKLQNKNKNLYVGEAMKEFCEELFPENAHEICNGKLYISIHVLTAFGIKRKVISKWDSREDLIDCVLASSTVPFITFPMWYYNFRGMKCIDGFYPESLGKTPTFFCNLWEIEYPSHLSGSITDENIHTFVEKGKDHFEKVVLFDYHQKGNIFHVLHEGYDYCIKTRLVKYCIKYFPICFYVAFIGLLFKKFKKIIQQKLFGT